MKRINQNIKSIFLWAILLLLVGCNNGNEKQEGNETKSQLETTLMEEPAERKEFLMGTYIVLRVYDEGKEEVLDEAVDRIKELDKKLTSNGPGSEIDAINQAAGEEAVEVYDDVFPLDEAAAQYSEVPRSGFDSTIGPITHFWSIGFDDARVPEREEIEKVLSLVNHEKVELDAAKRTVFLTEE